MGCGKKTMGRRKIPIQKIEKKSNLQVAFTKRRKGLFKKATELSVLCGAEIAILVQSPGNKVFMFGNPSVESVLRQFQRAYGEGEASSLHPCIEKESQRRYMEAVEKLEGEMEKQRKRMKGFGAMENWREEMGVEELEEYEQDLEMLMGNVLRRQEEMDKGRMAATAHTTSHCSDATNSETTLSYSLGPGDNHEVFVECSTSASACEIPAELCYLDLDTDFDIDICDLDWDLQNVDNGAVSSSDPTEASTNTVSHCMETAANTVFHSSSTLGDQCNSSTTCETPATLPVLDFNIYDLEWEMLLNAAENGNIGCFI